MLNKIDNPLISQYLFPVIEAGSLDKSEGKELNSKTDGHTALSCTYFEATPESPVILYFPSSSDTIASFSTMAEEFQKYNISTIYASYRGYGDSTGPQSFSTLLEDAGNLVEGITKQLSLKENKRPLFVMGQSLGTVFAIDAVLKNESFVKGLILDSSICETQPYLENIGVDITELDFTEEEGFNNLDKIVNIKLSTIIFHGSKDPIVNAAKAESLQACSGAKSKKFFVVPGGGHGDLATVGGGIYYQTIKSHLDTTCGVNTWREQRRKKK